MDGTANRVTYNTEDGVLFINMCRVPSLGVLKDRPINSNDFNDYRKSLDSHLITLINFIKNNLKEIKLKEMNHFKVSLLFVISEQTQNGIWATDSDALKKELLDLFLKFYTFEDDSLVIRFFKLFFEQLQPNLLKNNWKFNPASIQAHKFATHILLQKHLINKEFIHMVLTPLLLQIDDHESDNKLNGLETLSSIISSVEFGILVDYGLDTVIFEALKPKLHLETPQIVRMTILCLCPIICHNASKSSEMVESPVASSICLEKKFFRCYEILDIVFSNMIIASSVDTRTMYVETLPVIIKFIKTGIYSWANRLQEVLEYYLDTSVIENDVNEYILSRTILCLMLFFDYMKPLGNTIFEHLVDVMLLLLMQLIEESSAKNIKVSQKTMKILRIAIAIILSSNENKLSGIINHKIHIKFIKLYQLYNDQWNHIQQLINIEKSLRKDERKASENFMHYLEINC